jgi:hypothetical protein
VFRLTFRCTSSSTKLLVYRFFSSQVTPIYPLCHKLLTMSSCSDSSPPVTLFYALRITNISSGLFITKPHRQSSSTLHALTHTHSHTNKHTHTHTHTRRATKVALKTNKSEAGRGICSDYYHRDQIKHCTVTINIKWISSLQSTGYTLWKDQVYCMEGGLKPNNENNTRF